MNSVISAFSVQADACEGLGSLFNAALCRMLAKELGQDTAVGALCLNWKGDPSPSVDSIPLRLCGGLHALVVSGKDEQLAKHYPPVSSVPPSYKMVRNALVTHEEFLLEWMKSPPQTNEVARASVIWAGLMTISSLVQKPLHLLELGASAGLNLNLDQFCYLLGPARGGVTGSPVHLAPEWKGVAPTAHDVVVRSKQGCDINPLSAGNDDHALRLRAYCWPDQIQRMQRLNAALEIARQNPVVVERADAVGWLEQKLQDMPDDECTVIYSTIAWQYLPEAARARGEQLINEAARQGKSLAWLRFEADGKTPGAGVHLQVWPIGVDCLLGRADFHGRWVDWRGIE